MLYFHDVGFLSEKQPVKLQALCDHIFDWEDNRTMTVGLPGANENGKLGNPSNYFCALVGLGPATVVSGICDAPLVTPNNGQGMKLVSNGQSYSSNYNMSCNDYFVSQRCAVLHLTLGWKCDTPWPSYAKSVTDDSQYTSNKWHLHQIRSQA